VSIYNWKHVPHKFTALAARADGVVLMYRRLDGKRIRRGNMRKSLYRWRSAGDVQICARICHAATLPDDVDWRDSLELSPAGRTQRKVNYFTEHFIQLIIKS